MIARTMLGRASAVALSVALSQVAVPVAQAAGPDPSTPAAHLVTAPEVAARLIDGARSRQEKVRLFEAALATPEAQAKARALGLDPVQVQARVAHLSDRELEDLGQRAKRVQDVTAGHYHNSHDALIILGIVLLVALVVAIAVAGSDYNDCGCY